MPEVHVLECVECLDEFFLFDISFDQFGDCLDVQFSWELSVERISKGPAGLLRVFECKVSLAEECIGRAYVFALSVCSDVDVECQPLGGGIVVAYLIVALGRSKGGGAL